MIKRTIFLLGLIAIAIAVVGVHDMYCHYIDLDISQLCERPDGSLWRDPSAGCSAGNDPTCQSTDECANSVFVSEDWRHSCTWVFLHTEVAPNGEPPYHQGPSPGGGVPGRR